MVFLSDFINAVKQGSLVKTPKDAVDEFKAAVDRFEAAANAYAYKGVQLLEEHGELYKEYLLSRQLLVLMYEKAVF